MPWLRNSTLWVPLYFFMFLMIVVNLKKKAIPIAAFAIITVAITDYLSSKVFKPYFGRLRPCSDPDMAGMVRFLLDNKPANASFTSSHAANHFGIAMFFFLTLIPYFGNRMYLFFCMGFLNLLRTNICWRSLPI